MKGEHPGPRTRQAIERAIAPGGPGALTLRVLLAVVHMLTTRGKTADTVSTAQLARLVYGKPTGEITGWERRNVAKSLRELDALRVLEYEPGRGQSARSMITLPPMGCQVTPLDYVKGCDPVTEGVRPHPGRGVDGASLQRGVPTKLSKALRPLGHLATNRRQLWEDEEEAVVELRDTARLQFKLELSDGDLEQLLQIWRSEREVA